MKINKTMPQSIFENSFTLKFEDPMVEYAYQKYINKKIEKFSILFTLFNLVINLAMSIFVIYNVWNMSNDIKINSFLRISTLISSILLIISTFVIFFVKNIFIKIICFYFSFYLISFINYNIRILFVRIIVINTLNVFFNISEIILKFFWVVMLRFSFIKTFLVSILTCASCWLIYPFFFEEPNYYLYFMNLAFYGFGLITLTLFVYIYDKQQKTLFYYIQKAKIKANKLENVFE
jgi:hypothetical protein